MLIYDKQCIAIRTAEHKDYDEYMKLFNQNDFGCIGLLGNQKPSAYDEQLIFNEIVSKKYLESEILVITKNDVFIGYAIVNYDSNKRWHIGEFVINEKFRRKNMGTLMLRVILKIAKENDVEEIRLECLNSSKIFFEKNGFVTNSNNIRLICRLEIIENFTNIFIKNEVKLFPDEDILKELKDEKMRQKNESFIRFVKTLYKVI